MVPARKNGIPKTTRSAPPSSCRLIVEILLTVTIPRGITRPPPSALPRGSFSNEREVSLAGGRADALGQGLHVVRDACRGLVLGEENRRKGALLTNHDAHFVRVGGLAHRYLKARDVGSVRLSDLSKAIAKGTCRHREHAIRGGQRVHDGRLHAARARCGKQDDILLCLKKDLQPVRHLGEQARELGAAVVDRGTVDGAQDAVRDVGRARDVQEMATGWDGYPSVVVVRSPRASLRPAAYFCP